MPPVSKEFQLDFFRKMEGLILGSHHSASYKFALIMALADHSYQSGIRDDRRLEIPFDVLTRWFLSYYWPMSEKFQYQDGEVRLKQGFRRTAVMNNKNYGLLQYRQANREIKTFENALAREDFRPVFSKCMYTMIDQPLRYLQSQIRPFIYEYGEVKRGGAVRLKPGVAYCLKQFHDTIHLLCKSRWIDFVKRSNRAILQEDHVELMDFMFGVQRQNLNGARKALDIIHERLDLRKKCFYCGKSIRKYAVDHFIPWSTFSYDYGHNFVLSCNRCNSYKSNYLASYDFLLGWMEWIHHNDELIDEEMSHRQIPTNISLSVNVSHSAYNQAEVQSQNVWKGGSASTGLVHLDSNWKILF